MAKKVVRILSSRFGESQTWAPGDPFECRDEEEAQSMIDAGEAEPMEQEDSKPKKARKGE